MEKVFLTTGTIQRHIKSITSSVKSISGSSFSENISVFTYDFFDFYFILILFF